MQGPSKGWGMEAPEEAGDLTSLPPVCSSSALLTSRESRSPPGPTSLEGTFQVTFLHRPDLRGSHRDLSPAELIRGPLPPHAALPAWQTGHTWLSSLR